ncbi:MAG: hypothetical protein K2J58_03195 [Muribaculaceae bacterium]|nr:hypothetical protein [Muribaculaceae bacterium]
MKKIILLFLMVVAMTTSVISERRALPIRTHQSDSSNELTERDRNPIHLPIAVYYDSDTNILEVWCDDDNIQAEVYVYDENEGVEAYSPYMNICLQLTSSTTHSILIVGDGWEAEGTI